MAGSQQRRVQTKDFKDPFNAGQMVGMLVILTFIEKNRGIPEKVLSQLKHIAADNAEVYFDKPAEDIHLMIDEIVKGIEEI